MTPKPITRNTLCYGDNLPILRERISDGGVPVENRFHLHHIHPKYASPTTIGD
jgi:hypothetical protein